MSEKFYKLTEGFDIMSCSFCVIIKVVAAQFGRAAGRMQYGSARGIVSNGS